MSPKPILDPTQVLKFKRNTNVFFIKEGVDKLTVDAVREQGSFTYRIGNRIYSGKQSFYMTVDHCRVSERRHKEINLLVSLGTFLERSFKALRLQVIDIQLPKSHGYSGNSYGFHNTKRLFTHARIDRKTC